MGSIVIGIYQDRTPRWSPDGTRIAFMLGQPPWGGVAVYSFGSHKYERLATIGDWPLLLPDGRRLIFHHRGKA
jgi:Tol biopolymer transport system component